MKDTQWKREKEKYERVRERERERNVHSERVKMRYEM